MFIKLKYLIYILLSLLAFTVFSCRENEKEAYLNRKSGQLTATQLREKSLKKVNSYLVRRESEEIENFINRHGWNVVKTGTGLRYEIYKHGAGRKAKDGDIVTLNYKMYLITGDLIYTSDSLGPKVFKVGKSNVETGLDEVVKYMSKGDKAHVILPSHLAFGLKGDLKKIPKRATVIYDLELTEIK